ncbi:unnamed protein product, partial [Owenia fusiformis]
QSNAQLRLFCVMGLLSIIGLLIMIQYSRKIQVTFSKYRINHTKNHMDFSRDHVGFQRKGYRNKNQVTRLQIQKIISTTNKPSTKTQTISKDQLSGFNEILQARKVESDKYIVYMCKNYCGGLGDRLKGIYSTFWLAMALKRKFRIISTNPCDLYNQLGENHEPWHGSITHDLKNRTIHMIDEYDKCGEPIFGKGKNFPEPVVVIETNQGWTTKFHEEPYKSMLWNQGFNISHFTADEMFSSMYNHLFKLQLNLLKLLDEFIARAKSKPNVKLVCAQIRSGLNPSIPEESRIRNKDEWFPVLWDFLSLYNDSSKYSLFVTTDSQQIRENSQKLFPDIILDTDGDITHIDRFRNKTKACEGMEKTILDFSILANCDIIIVSRSNFGKYASQLRSPGSKLYTFHEGIIHEGPEGSMEGKVFNRTTKAFTDDCNKVICPTVPTKCENK